jgi:hypothetical protein
VGWSRRRRTVGLPVTPEAVDEGGEPIDRSRVEVGTLPPDRLHHPLDRGGLDVAPLAVLEVFGDQPGVLGSELPSR